jgi:hypothetical protein
VKSGCRSPCASMSWHAPWLPKESVGNIQPPPTRRSNTYCDDDCNSREVNDRTRIVRRLLATPQSSRWEAASNRGSGSAPVSSAARIKWLRGPSRIRTGDGGFAIRCPIATTTFPPKRLWQPRPSPWPIPWPVNWKKTLTWPGSWTHGRPFQSRFDARWWRWSVAAADLLREAVPVGRIDGDGPRK